jgi:uncharacterized protein
LRTARNPKELFIIPGASHIDLYDKAEYVPQVVGKLTDFYTKNLATSAQQEVAALVG